MLTTTTVTSANPNGEQVALQIAGSLNSGDVVREPDELPLAEPDRVGEAEEDADDRGQGDRQREQDEGGNAGTVVDRLDRGGASAPVRASRALRDEGRVVGWLVVVAMSVLRSFPDHC